MMQILPFIGSGGKADTTAVPETWDLVSGIDIHYVNQTSLLKKKKNLPGLLKFRGLNLGSLWTILMLYGLQLKVLILESWGNKMTSFHSYFLTIYYDVNMGKNALKKFLTLFGYDIWFTSF